MPGNNESSELKMPSPEWYIHKCFQNVLNNSDRWQIKKLAMPAIGAGIGGLDWTVVKALMEDFAYVADFEVIVYEKFEPGK